jgi:hypothetical protein
MADANTEVSELSAPLLPESTAAGSATANGTMRWMRFNHHWRLAPHRPHRMVAGNAPVVVVESEPASPHGLKAVLGSTHWILTTCILLGDMFGLGTLSLPADFARLGWVPALSFLLAFSMADLYSGSLYTRLCTHLPSAIMFDHIGEAAMGKVGRWLVYGTCYLTILGEPVIFHLTSVESLMQVLDDDGVLPHSSHRGRALSC